MEAYESSRTPRALGAGEVTVLFTEKGKSGEGTNSVKQFKFLFALMAFHTVTSRKQLDRSLEVIRCSELESSAHYGILNHGNISDHPWKEYR